MACHSIQAGQDAGADVVQLGILPRTSVCEKS